MCVFRGSTRQVIKMPAGDRPDDNGNEWTTKMSERRARLMGEELRRWKNKNRSRSGGSAGWKRVCLP